jgi:hypothetical protein
MSDPFRELFRFPSGNAVDEFLADLKAQGTKVNHWAITPDPEGPGVILVVEIESKP